MVITIITMIITRFITWHVPTSLSLRTLSIEVSTRVSPAEPLLQPLVWGGHPNLSCRPNFWSNSPTPILCGETITSPTLWRRSLTHLPPAPISTVVLPPSTPNLHRWVDLPVRNFDAASSPPHGRCAESSHFLCILASVWRM